MRKPPSHAVAVEIAVPFHDVDALHVAWHGHYLKYFEIARTELFRRRGFEVREHYETDLVLVVMESYCRHVAPLRMADRARVFAWVTDAFHRIRVEYRVDEIETGRRIAYGYTHLVTLRDGQLMLETPPDIRRRLEAHGADDANV